jgi:hypothetical protein
MNYNMLDLETLKDIRAAKLRLHVRCTTRNPNYKGSCLNDLDIIEKIIILKEKRL